MNVGAVKALQFRGVNHANGWDLRSRYCEVGFFRSVGLKQRKRTYIQIIITATLTFSLARKFHCTDFINCVLRKLLNFAATRRRGFLQFD
jgi:hypothetical protein